jgi:hypothetical protein
VKIIDCGYGHDESLLDAILQLPTFAHVATLSKAGPRHSPVWFLWEDGAVWIIANEKDTLWKRIRDDPRAAIGIVDFKLPAGRVRHVGMRGAATVQSWDRARAARLLSRYLGPDQSRWEDRIKFALDDNSNRWIRFEAETVVVRDQSYSFSRT